jgi:hypothetical protein
MHISGRVSPPVIKSVIYTDMPYDVFEVINKVLYYLTMFNKPDDLQVVYEWHQR